jgi:RsiW-degrading membrane proteinase PrsW (M82 family)
VIALAGGLLPALVWLWFWMRQDKNTPEPDGLIALSFFAGMAVVFFVLPLQQLIASSMALIMSTTDILAIKLSLIPPQEQTVRVTLWAFVEEVAKYSTVFFIAFKSKYFDEPKDAIIYLITAALGFAAMENTLYLYKIITHTGVADGLNNISSRFIGATTVHIVSSAFIGLAIALAFYAPKAIKFIAATLGILVATLLHAYFNLSIMSSDTTLKQLVMFSPFWAAIVGIIILLALIERVTKTNKIIT